MAAVDDMTSHEPIKWLRLKECKYCPHGAGNGDGGRRKKYFLVKLKRRCRVVESVVNAPGAFTRHNLKAL